VCYISADMAPPQYKSRTNTITVVYKYIGKAGGRIRLNIDSLYRSRPMAEWLRRGFADANGIALVTANWRTGSLLIVFDTAQQSIKELTAKVNDLCSGNPITVRKEYYRRHCGHTHLRPIAKTTPWHCMSEQQVLLLCQSTSESGLTDAMARRHLQKYGRNLLPTGNGRSEWEIYCHQFKNLPVALLLGSAVLSVATGGVIDAVVILAVVLVNAQLGYLTESSAEKTVQSLNQVHYPDVLVMRDGRQISIATNNLTVGDILFLSPGLYVPADARLLITDGLYVDESILTGESLPVHKYHHQLADAALSLGDQINMLFRGTTVISGSGKAVVTATGAATELGAIQVLMKDARQPDTPLEKQLAVLGKKMVGTSLGISLLVFLLGIARRSNWLTTFKTAISLAVAAIPEGLPAVATVSLATGIRRLAKHHLLVRHLDAVETLGNIDVVCFDKTGTLTLNEMAVLDIQLHKRTAFAVDESTKLKASIDLAQLIETAVLCNEAKASGDNIIGSATEAALLSLAIRADVDIDKLRSTFPIVFTQYRSENRNYMLSIHKASSSFSEEPLYIVAAKGQPSELLKRCSHYWQNGKAIALTPQDRRIIEQHNASMANRALRVLGVAYQKLTSEPALDKVDLIWLGLVGLADPCRPGIKELITTLHNSGVRTVMITGDQTPTALAIGKELNIGDARNLKALDYKSVANLDPQDFALKIKDAHVFSRVSPSHKLHIVQALQSTSKVVAMTGDGINDGPALKVADIGIALSGTESDVAQRVADLVIAKNNLFGLVRGIEEGRTIHQNLRKAVRYILSQNMSEMIFTFSSSLFGFGEPLTPMQLLWVNLVTDILPELALSQEPPESDVLQSYSKKLEHQLLSSRDIKAISFQSLMLSSASLMGYLYGVKKYGIGEAARSMGFVTLNSASLLHTFSSRSTKSSIFSRHHPSGNKYIPLAVLAGFVAELIAIYGPFKRILGTVPLKAPDLLASLAFSAAPFFIIEGTKGRLVNRKRTRNVKKTRNKS